jgi:hypothetical protein
MHAVALDEGYLNWLTNQVSRSRSRAKVRNHRKLFQQLQDTIFVAVVPFDDNRIADARDLRYEYLAETEDEAGDPDWTRSPASMLEVLIVLSRALAFEMDDPVTPWFWHLIETLELERFNDREYDNHAQEAIAETLDRVIWRRYAADGSGGLFPLRRPERDQRKVELWYQLNAYLLEQF